MKHVRKFRESNETNARMMKLTKIARIREKTSYNVNELILATNEAKEANRAAMARQMARENAFEPSGSPLSY
jgi:hypothetical protein